MNQQSNFHQRINIDGAASVEGQVGQAGRDLIQFAFNIGLFRREVKPSTQQEYRWRKQLLDQVQKNWVKDVLERSLHNQAMIDLGLETRDDLVKRPFSKIGIPPQESQQPVSTTGGINTAFGGMGERRTLLILGEPGAGKTTMLLKLTRELIAERDKSLNQPIPVVLNLSSWAKKRQKIADWLVDELHGEYHINKPTGKGWVQEQQLLLLLDGLDEVKAEYREACVQAINQFMQDYGLVEMVVCSRIKDYKALPTRLKMRGAIYVQPLTSEQVNQYLDKAGSQLQGVRTLLQQDTALQEMMKSPLILSIVSIAYKDMSAENLSPMGSIEERRQHIFDTYIERMFHPHGRTPPMKYKPEETKRWLTWLATRMVQESQTVFLIEKIQFTWLEKKGEHIFYFIVSMLASGLTVGLIVLLRVGLTVGLGVVPGVVLISGIISGLTGAEIKTVESLKWSSQRFIKAIRQDIRGLYLNFIQNFQFDLISFIIFLLISFIIFFPFFLLSFMLFIARGFHLSVILILFIPFIGFFVVLTFLIFLSFLYALIEGLKGPEIETKKVANQGLKKSAFNALFLGIIMTIVAGILGLGIELIIILLQIIITQEISQVIHFGYSRFSMPFGLIMGIIFGGGYAVFQHLTLRSMLYQKGFAPWNYARFLDYATELIFMQKVGGGYIFIHRMLLEHFAKIKP
ncbi:NACHT domain-containing NTPase [Okeania sp. SIO2B3]|uniref:NACHT domain-containing protein n=1 Tax=Okeania sp. SIO2B3 TaxID=2607784 RepID=UPI0025F48C46|nr:NACHT domain-containing protein [Okeania sp. SIO2B3]